MKINDYKDREIFVEWSIEKGFDENDVWNFLYYMLAPMKLNGFFPICSNYKEVLKYISEYKKVNHINEDTIKKWKLICNEVEQGRNELNEKIDGDFIGDKNKGNDKVKIIPPTYGQLIDFPISTALYHEVECSELIDNYYRLFALILSCQYRVLNKNPDFTINKYKDQIKGKEFHGYLRSSFVKMGKLLRELTYRSESDFLEKITQSDAMGIVEFHNRINCLEREDPENTLLNTIRVFLDRTISDIDSNDWGGAGSKAGRKGTVRYGYNKGTGFILFDSKNKDKKTIIKIPVSDGFIEEWEEAGLLTGEIFDELYLECETEEYETTDKENIPYSAKKTITDEQRRYAAIHNNYLNTAWEKMSNYEQNEFYSYLLKEAENIFECKVKKDGTKENIIKNLLIDMESIVILLIMLITASSWSRARKLLYLRSNTVQKSEIVYLYDKNLFRIKIKLPKINNRVKKDDEKYIEANTDLLLIPDFFQLGKYLAEINKLQKEIVNKKLTPLKSARAFKVDSNIVKKRVNNILKNFNKNKRVPVSIKNIEKIMQRNLITVSSGDTVVPEMISGIEGLGTWAQHHYAMPSPAYLESKYRAAISVYEGVDTIKIPYCNSDNERISNWKCVKTSAIKDCLIKCKEDTNINKLPKTLKEIARIHNAYTTYTLIPFLISTGYRFSINPDSDPSLISKDGFLVFGDKISEDEYQTRLSWIPDKVIKQLEYYSEDRKKVLDVLYSKIKFGQGYFKKIETFMFYIDPDVFEPVEVRPSNWNDIVNDFFPLPMNFSRAYMRTYLMMNGCPSDIINAYMGHVQNGLESYGEKSSLSPLDYKEVIKKYVNKVIKNIAFSPIREFINEY